MIGAETFHQPRVNLTNILCAAYGLEILNPF